MYNEIRGFKYIFKISKRFLKKFIKANSLYIKLLFLYFIRLYDLFNVSYVMLACYTFNFFRLGFVLYKKEAYITYDTFIKRTTCLITSDTLKVS